MANDQLHSSHASIPIALPQPMRLLLVLPVEPIRTADVAEVAGFGDAWDLRKIRRIMSVLSGRNLVKRVGAGTYQITSLGLKVQAQFKQ